MSVLTYDYDVDCTLSFPSLGKERQITFILSFTRNDITKTFECEMDTHRISIRIRMLNELSNITVHITLINKN